MDGWFKASESMKDYIKIMFPGEWSDDINFSKQEVETHILQSETLVDIGEDVVMNFNVLIKKDNRRKANSHEWFFNAFAENIDADYTFATDCGTLFDENCLLNLLEYIERHNEVSGVTGRQRVMSQDQQEINYESYKGMWYRAGQAYDYESSISSFQGSFSLFGMLPVLPGPCGLYRYSDIKGECLDYYFDMINNNGPESGIVIGNLLIAEDRILSFAASLKTGKYTRWVPSSIFYFEAETKTKNFITQRRRWTNGALAGYIYLCFMNPGIIWKSKHTIYFKIINYFLMLVQFCNFMFTSLSPGIFIALSARSIKELNMFTGSFQDICSYVISGVYFALLLSFVIIHYRNKFIGWSYKMMMYINTLMFLFVLASFIKIIFLGEVAIITFLCISLFTPFLLALFHSLDVFIMMMVNFLPFLLFLPTFIPLFVTYAYTRTWDLTWGNRPSDSMEEVKKDKDKVINSLKTKGLIFIISVLLCNLGIIYVLNVFNYDIIVFVFSIYSTMFIIYIFRI
jgi:chitin synthase